MLSLTGLGEIPSPLIKSAIRRVRIHAGGKFWETDCRSSGLNRYGVVLDRAAFDHWLMERAERLGAELLEESVVDLSRLKWSYLVGADGVNSVVRKWLGLPRPPLEDLHFCVQTEPYWSEYPDGEINIYFGEVSPKGYAWTFPAGDRVRIGLGIPLSLGMNPRKLLDKFVETIGAPKGEIIAKVIPTSRPMKSCVFGDKVALVGDAALHCDPSTGGGIANALISGGFLGEALSMEDLSWYDRMWKRTVGRRNWTRYLLKRILSSLGEEEYQEMMRALQGFTPTNMVIERSLSPLVTRVCTRSPRLLNKILKMLLFN
jgi:digeranylgeranylglycerophospholipid reductase